MRFITILAIIPFFLCQCNGKKNIILSQFENQSKVDSSLFIEENLIEPITTQKITLDDGREKMYYKIVITPEPKEHETGPWCPKTITDSKENGGIWFKDGHLYDVDGSFIAHLDEFYSDPKWKVHKEDGNIKITESQEACEGAAKPNVDKEYHNYCVECLPKYYPDIKNTYLIPLEPVYKENITHPSREGIGLAFNGVKFDSPAPIHAILAAHTIAPLDDCGGHVNPHIGYHYHAATGCTKQIAQKDKHAPLIGYAIDGFGIYALLNENDIPPSNLDQCNGHSDETRGYHYHAGKPGDNQIIKCLHGEIAHIKRRRPRH